MLFPKIDPTGPKTVKHCATSPPRQKTTLPVFCYSKITIQCVLKALCKKNCVSSRSVELRVLNVCTWSTLSENQRMAMHGGVFLFRNFRHQNTTPQHIVNQLFSSCMLFRWLNSFIKWKNRDAMTQTSVTDIDEVEYSGSYVIGHDHWLSDHNVWGFAVQTGTNSWWHSMNNDDHSFR